MKTAGIIRKVDDLGRVVLPMELRQAMDIEKHDSVEIFMENDHIMIQKFEPACIFCGSVGRLVVYGGKNICQDCIDKISEL